ncbi:hypothetical protein KO488_11520 [Poseidonibacter lekithochrous]|uniref:hypothetical protein n=1 Tax=Poseidonibacter TaxID=2321187 RepID=UPI001C09F004|nr:MULTISPECIES: hypothetical protein [Poseidonibacter]MBU3015390.1 hypothetical protein [Poseidonibacter lekithochrous]MDO6828689.1 hypothetical protein [Poseidonibacter sp. 1_MG-2023]
MKSINRSAKPKKSNLGKILFFIILIMIAIFSYLLTKKTPSKKQSNAFSALYSGESKTNNTSLPEKLKWSDSFKGVNNMGNK